MDLIMLPTEALGYPKTSPLFLVKDLEGPRLTIEIVLRDLLKHRLRKHDMPAVAQSAYPHVREDPGRMKMLFVATYTRTAYPSTWISKQSLAWQFCGNDRSLTDRNSGSSQRIHPNDPALSRSTSVDDAD